MELQIDGEHAYAYTGGKPFNPDLPVVVFVHGAQNDHSVWTLQTRWFAHHGYGVLAIDLPGHHRSAGEPLDTVEAMADWVMRLITAASVTQPVMVVGHSMGSLIALECAHRHPDRVRAIALVGCAYPMKVSDALLAASQYRVPDAIDMVTQWSHSSLANKPSFPGPGFWMQGVGQRLMERVAARNPAPVFHRDLAACNAYAGGDSAAAAVQCPVQFILGKRDMMTPRRAGEALAQRMPQAKVVVLDCGHAVMGEAPDATLDTLAAFARRCP